jgi:aldose 1-epimerase
MYKVEVIKENEARFFELSNREKTSSASICLEEGGRLKELKFNGVFLIKEQTDFEYKDSYASSILFPFVSRIQDGKYSFQENDYQLNCNQTGENALHGLVYNKKFELIEKEETTNRCSVTIGYKETKESPGFPYTYEIYLTYLLTEKEISLSVKIKNTDTKAFPFTLGWHPYFICDDLSKSVVCFKSDKKIAFDENLITKEVVAHKTPEVFKIENKQLDDCFILKTNKIGFSTPTYQIEITTDLEDNYLQMYTPLGLSVIAIEPMTGVSNSFNNKIGLQVLQPTDSYSLMWNVKFNNNYNH